MMNIYRISYFWSGGGIILLQVMSPSGSWIPFHQYQLTNAVATTIFTNPCIPIYAQVIGLNSSAQGALSTSCWNAGSIGNVRDGEEVRNFSVNNSGVLVTNATITPILSIQTGSTFNGSISQIEARLRAWSGRVTGATDPDAAAVYLIKNATLTGSSFTAVSSGNSMMSVDTSATALSGGTILLFQATSSDNAGSGSHTKYFSDADLEILLQPGDTYDGIQADILTIGAKSLLTTSTVSGSLSWEERN